MCHFSEYLIFSFLITRALRPDVAASTGLRYLLAFALAGLYGITDEIHQAFVPGRDPSGLDFLADLSGSAGGVFLHRCLRRISST